MSTPYNPTADDSLDERGYEEIKTPKQMSKKQNTKAGLWNEKTQSYIKPTGTVKQGRRPMFKPFDERPKNYNVQIACGPPRREGEHLADYIERTSKKQNTKAETFTEHDCLECGQHFSVCICEEPQAEHSYEVKPIPGFNGYLASSVGDIISSSHDWRGQGERVMTQTLNEHGYPTVRLQIGKKRQMITVHKLVLLAFHGSPATAELEARHLNGIRHDNRMENLQWGTRTENAADREAHGNTARGSKHSDIIRASLRERQQAAEKLIVASVNQAQALAEALKCAEMVLAERGVELKEITRALANWEGAK